MWKTEWICLIGMSGRAKEGEEIQERWDKKGQVI